MNFFKRLTIVGGILFLSSAWGYADSDQLDFVTCEWYPYTTQTTLEKGFFTEIVTTVVNDMDMTANIVFIENNAWNVAEFETQAGRFFAAMPYRATQERQKIYDFSEPVCESVGRFFYYAPRLKNPPLLWKNYKDLKLFVVAIVAGYWFEKSFKKNKLTLFETENDEEAFRLQKFGQVDLVPCDEIVGREIIDRLFPGQTKDFKTLPKPLNKSPLQLMVSRQYPHSKTLLALFNKSLNRIKQDGRIDRILSKYNLK